MRTFSVAIARDRHHVLSHHLTRSDGQEDLCFALWRPSTGHRRTTAVINDAVLPLPGERAVHGTASFNGEYALRAARIAAEAGAGVAFMHSHPGATTWQSAADGSADAESERKIANLAREYTGLPLVGMTLSTGSQTWSARAWDRGRGAEVARTEAESVRVLGSTFHVGFHPLLRPAPALQPTQIRTLHSWGEEVQSHLARLRVLVVGGGSVGQVVLEMLARTGVQHIAVMDFDTVKEVNLDRLHGATALDAHLLTSKAELGHRAITQAATAESSQLERFETSICQSDGLSTALDFDVIFSCVDRPWPRHVLNTIAYSGVVPVVDGGVRLEPGQAGGLRNAYWRSHVAGPGRTCLRCLDQFNVADVQLERDGSLDDPSYIAQLPVDSPLRTRQNVYATSLAAASSLTNQFLSLVVAPSGFGDPGALRHDLRQHIIERTGQTCAPGCTYTDGTGEGDGRPDPTGHHEAARREIAQRTRSRRRVGVRAARGVVWLSRAIEAQVGRTGGRARIDDPTHAHRVEP